MARAEEFRVEVSDRALEDVHRRLQHVRWPEDLGNDDWSYGTQLGFLQKLVDHWLHKYDWRVHEAAINELPQFRVQVDGVPVHYVHVRGVGPDPQPLILSHGWPGTFWDYRKVIGPLTDPAAFGGDPRDAFDVVIPSLPGFGFSTPLRQSGVNYWTTADLWVRLMGDVLGYERFAAYGEDWGSFISAQLGHKYPEKLLGVHLTLLSPLSLSEADVPGLEMYAESERGWIAKNVQFILGERAYWAVHSTKPQSLSYALHDSPVGLCAWIMEKMRSWSDCGGELERRFSYDELLTNVMLYWLTDSTASSLRYYAELRRNPWQPSHAGEPVVRAPTGVSVFPGEVALFPRRWAASYYNLQSWEEMPTGGHFAASEEPDLVVDGIRRFFRGLRPA